MRHRAVFAAILLLGPALGGCSRRAGLFSDQNAHAHIQMLAATIGSRPVGTSTNLRAREYVIDRLKLYGFDVRVQDTDARRAELGRTARVSNVIGVRQGSRREAVGLVAHYDSSPYAPGAADDGLGVAVSLEAARVLAAKPNRTWTIFVLLTDAEESGLMGAAGLMTDREVTDRLHAYINIDAAGSASPAVLFETGPGNPWLAAQWATRAPHPRGGSFGFEVYRRLPNDTDFSILKTRDIPGLNFATVGDSYAYHTARDTPDRVSMRAVRETGENVVSIVDALDRVDITRRTTGIPTYFDIGGTVALSYGPAPAWLIGLASLLLGAVAWVKVTAFAVRTVGIWRCALAALWTSASLLAVVGAMIGATWAIRASREVYHPWYAHPDRLMFLLATVAVTAGWTMSRAGMWLPARAHPLRHPAMTWSLALPLWMVFAATAFYAAPAAAYLWTLPLLSTATVLLLTPAQSAIGIRAASVIVLAVSASLWLRETVDLVRFIVALFGRLALVTPVFVYAAVIAVAGVMIVPPLVAAVSASRPLPRPTLVTALCLLSIAIGAGAVYVAPAYTHERPLRRVVRALQEPESAGAVWEVASVEPGLDLADNAPGGWVRQSGQAPASIPWGTLPHPFVFRATGPPLGPAPVGIAGFALQAVEAGLELTLTVVPRRSGLTLSFILPAGMTPARSSLPGVSRQGRWTASYVAPPADGIVWRAVFSGADAAPLRGVRVSVSDPGFPGGEGWQRLPAWLPQEQTVWAGTATWVVVPDNSQLPTSNSQFPTPNSQ